MEKKVKLVIFDFDGTLADSFDWFVKNIRSLSKKYKFKNVKDEDVPTLRNHDARYMMKYVGFPVLQLPIVAKHMRKLMNNEIDRIKLFPGIPKQLKHLTAAGCKIAVVSTNSVQNVQQVLGKELCSLINHFACGVSMFGKESKLKHAAKKCGELIADCVYIADELRDIEAAHKIGMKFGAVSWGYTNPDALKQKNPEYFFEDITAIFEKLCNEH